MLDKKNKKLLYICPSTIYNQLLEEVVLLMPFSMDKVITIDDLKHKIFFDYNLEAKVYLVEHYQYPITLCNRILSLLYYLDIDKEYSDSKINNLKSIYQELKAKDLLTITPNFLAYLKNYHLVFFNLYEEEDDVRLLLKQIVNITSYEFIDNYSNQYDLQISEFKTLNQEVQYVANKIAKLIDNGVDINSIYLVNASNEYNFTLQRIFNAYNIPLSTNYSPKLNEISLFWQFINEIKKTTCNLALQTVVNNNPNDPNLEEFKDKMIKIINQYAFYQKPSDNLINFIISDAAKTSLASNNLKNKVNVISIDEVWNQDTNYYFIINCNYGNLPIISKDEDYLLDNQKVLLNLNTSSQINCLNNRILTKKIKSMKNLTLSYKLSSYFNEYHPSEIIKTLNIKVDKETNINEYTSYSKLNDTLNLTRFLDNYTLDNKEEYYYDLFNSINIDYKIYDNTFKGVDEKLLQQYFADKPLKLSYTSLDCFYHCHFKYYLTNILKIDSFETTIYLALGVIFHEVLSKSFEADFDFETSFALAVANAAKKQQFSASDNFFIANLKKELEKTINYNLEIYQKSDFKNQKFETKFNVNSTNFNGIIDRVIYQEINNEKYLIVIDYKTGETEINIDYIQHGLSMQLPVYLYLLRNSEEFKDYNILGFYLQKVINKEDNLDEGKVDDKKLKLKGYTLDNKDMITHFDHNFPDDSIVYGLKLKIDGEFRATSKVLSKTEIEELINIVRKNIELGKQKIQRGEFIINPVKIKNESIACKYCNFVDVCFKTKKDERELVIVKAGDDNVD